MSKNLTQILCQFLSSRNCFAFGLSFFAIYFALSTASWGQEIELDIPEEDKQTKPLIVPASQGQTITDIQVRFVDSNNQPVAGKSKPDMIIREFDRVI